MITAVILTHNSEKTLGNTLGSLSFCDEVVVVDDDSTDATQKIAKEYKARIYDRYLDDDFASQRNFGLEKATHEWVLFVDSDEIIPPELAREIETVITATEKNISGYFISRQDYFGGRGLTHGETSSVKLLRLAKKHAGHWIEPVHEIWQIRGETGTLQNPIHHLPHNDVAQFLSKINRYSSIRARFLYANGVRSSILQIIAYPKAKFIVNYIGKLGFLDGMEGLTLAMMMSFHSFLVRAKVWTLQRHIKE